MWAEKEGLQLTWKLASELMPLSHRFPSKRVNKRYKIIFLSSFHSFGDNETNEEELAVTKAFLNRKFVELEFHESEQRESLKRVH